MLDRAIAIFCCSFVAWIGLSMLRDPWFADDKVFRRIGLMLLVGAIMSSAPLWMAGP